MSERIYLSPPDVGDLEEASVVAALRSGWVAPLGPDVDAFEREVADRVGVGHGVALSSGTAALHLGLIGIGVGSGDVVITSTMTFAATANAIVYTGAEPVFVDSAEGGGNIDPVLLEAAVAEVGRSGRRIGAIVPVDLFGKVAEWERISPVADSVGIPVLWDAAESLGAARSGRVAGSLGKVAAVSFNGNKVMTTSGGGMLLSDDADLAARARYLSTQARRPAQHYEHDEIGYNYRLSNLLAALGRAQLSRLDSMIAKRRQVREMYRQAFAAIPGVRILGGDDDADDNCWLTSIIVDPAEAGWEALELGAALAILNIECRPLWKPMHLQPVFRDAMSVVNGTAQLLFERGLTLPSGSALDTGDRARILDAISGFLAERT